MPALTHAAATTGVKSPYLQSSDSPLVTSSPGFKLDAFEPSSPSLATIGVTLTTVHGSSVVTGLSVDADDGSVDGSGAAGHSLSVVTQFGTTGATFTFNSVTLGAYPKSAAVAVTAENAQPLLFTVYDTANAVSGTYSLSAVGTSSPTADDFLFWASDASGIGAISVSSGNAQTYMFLDHLQLDTVNTVSVPEPALGGAVAAASIMLSATPHRGTRRRRCGG